MYLIRHIVSSKVALSGRQTVGEVGIPQDICILADPSFDRAQRCDDSATLGVRSLKVF